KAWSAVVYATSTMHGGPSLPSGRRLVVAGPPVRAGDYEPWPLLHLLVDAAHVLAQDPEADQLDAGREQNEHNDRGIAVREVAAGQREDHVKHAGEEGEGG